VLNKKFGPKGEKERKVRLEEGPSKCKLFNQFIECKMSEIRNMHGIDEKCIQNFNRIT
jgi:hypothetical protein